MTGYGHLLATFTEFLRLGLVSFGGPIAHLGYFHARFVRERRWLDEARFAELVALAQLLPGPASSQVAMGIGHLRAGLAGLFAAWLGFTLPSALLMVLAGTLVLRLDLAVAGGPLHGLEIVALAVVADACLRMTRRLGTEPRRLALAFAGALAAAGIGGTPGQFLALGLGALGGLAFRLGTPPPVPSAVAAHRAALWLGLFGLGLILLPLAARTGHPLWMLADGCYRAGALVFGGGHVVLPLLRNAVVLPGLVQESLFLAGYGLAQAVPGPLVSLAAYLGMVAEGGGLHGALVALLAIYAPSWFLMAAGMPMLAALRRHRPVLDALAGIEAAVVGLLAAALYDPMFVRAVDGWPALLLALAAFLALRVLPVWLLVPLGALAGTFLA